MIFVINTRYCIRSVNDTVIALIITIYGRQYMRINKRSGDLERLVDFTYLRVIFPILKYTFLLST